MKVKKILFVAVAFVGLALTTGLTQEAEAGLFRRCKWATREVSGGWEAICIETGVGNKCRCGKVKSDPGMPGPQ